MQSISVTQSSSLYAHRPKYPEKPIKAKIKMRTIIKKNVFVIISIWICTNVYAQVNKPNNNLKLKIPAGAVEVICNDKGVRFTGSLYLTLYEDTIDRYGTNRGPSGGEEIEVGFIMNDGLEIEDEKQALWFNNLFTHHYGSEFICLEETNNYYKIMVNTSGKSYWIQKSKLLQFNRIEDYFMEFYGIFLTRGQNIRTSPDPTSSIIPIKGDIESLQFDVIQSKGDWLQIKQSDNTERNPKQPNFKTGWVKWFSGNKLIVGIIDSY